MIFFEIPLFLHIGKLVLCSVPTGVENLISLIKCAAFTVVHNGKLFLQAQLAFFGDWVMAVLWVGALSNSFHFSSWSLPLSFRFYMVELSLVLSLLAGLLLSLRCSLCRVLKGLQTKKYL